MKGGDDVRGPRNRTEFIVLDTSMCRACWECNAACTRGVLGKISVPFHKHARVACPADCRGCGKCVVACPEGAIRLLADRGKGTVPEGIAPSQWRSV
jgi:MinD superfamily P-loop ATPase